MLIMMGLPEDEVIWSKRRDCNSAWHTVSGGVLVIVFVPLLLKDLLE